MKKLLLTLILIPLISYNQELAYGNSIEGIEICKQLSYDSSPMPLDKEVDETLEKILSIVGLEKNFQLQMCSNIKNASALTYNGFRYVFYDKNFLNSISGENRWFVTFVLAHEVAHHLNHHTKDVMMYINGFPDNVSLENRRKQELEADKFAGFILGKLGCDYSDAINAVSQIPGDEFDNPNSEHPYEGLRIESLVEGYNKAIGGIGGLQFDKYEVSNSGKYLIYFYDGVEKQNNGDLEGALKDYDRAIIDKKEIPEPYINRALIKEQQGDLYGAISDIDLAIIHYKGLDRNLDRLYVERGKYKEKLGLYKSALQDYDIAISKNKNTFYGYYTRANLKSNILNQNFIDNSLYSSIDVFDIIEDYSKCIEIYPDFLEARNYRSKIIIAGLTTGITKNYINTALDDVDISLAYCDEYTFLTPISLKEFKLQNYSNRAALNFNLKKNFSSILSDANKIINLSKDYIENEQYQVYLLQGYIYKIMLLSNENSYYYDKFETCENINQILEMFYSKDELGEYKMNELWFTDNNIISSGISLITDLYLEIECP